MSKAMHGLKTIIQNASWLATEQIIRLVAGLFIGIWIARHLGPQEYGALSFALALSSLIGIFATLGLNRTVIRELALNTSDEAFGRRILGSTLGWRIIFSIGCYVLTISISLFFDQGQPLIVGIVSASITFNSFDTFDAYFQSRISSRHTAIARSISFFIFLFLKITLLIKDAGVNAFAIITTLEAAGNALALWFANYLYGIRIRRKDIDLRYGWQLICQCWPELFAGFACLIFMRIDQIMLGNMLGESAVGQYSVASRLAESWYFIPSALVASSFPSIVQQRGQDKSIYLKRIHQLMLALVIISYSVALLTQLLGPFAIDFLFGNTYQSSSSTLVILIWSGLFISLGTASGSWIMAEGKLMLNLSRNMIGAVTNIALNFYLIPKHGAVGAAVATLISLSIAYFFSDFINPTTREIGFIKLKSLLLIWK